MVISLSAVISARLTLMELTCPGPPESDRTILIICQNVTIFFQNKL